MYITLLNCQCDVFWPCIAIIIAVFLKKTAAIETAVETAAIETAIFRT